MSDSERRQRGEEMIKKVYAGDVVTPPEGASADQTSLTPNVKSPSLPPSSVCM